MNSKVAAGHGSWYSCYFQRAQKSLCSYVLNAFGQVYFHHVINTFILTMGKWQVHVGNLNVDRAGHAAVAVPLSMLAQCVDYYQTPAHYF